MLRTFAERTQTMGRVDDQSEIQGVHLSGLRAEFCTALSSEIEAAERQSSSSAVQLLNGRRIGQIGEEFQYLFDIENVINLPGDAPGDLHVSGFEPFPVKIVSVEGLALTLSVNIDLGAYVATARLQSSLAHLMRKLIQRIEVLGDRENRTGDRILGLLPVEGASTPMEFPNLPPLWELSPDQEKAVASSLGRNTTFIWGPPGTGKTLTIGAIGNELHHRGRSLLLVSHTNIAVDQAVLKIKEGMSKKEIEDGCLIRVGTTKDPEIQKDAGFLLAYQVKKRSKDLTDRRTALDATRKTAIEKVKEASLLIEICEWVIDAPRDIDEMSQNLGTLQESEAQLNGTRQEFSRLAASAEEWAAAERDAQRAQTVHAALDPLGERESKAQSALLQKQNEYSRSIQRVADAAALLEKTSSAGWIKRAWKSLPHPDEQQRVVESLRAELANLESEVNSLEHELARCRERREHIQNDLEGFKQRYNSSPEEVLADALAQVEAFAQAKSRVEQLTRKCRSGRVDLTKLLTTRLAVLRDRDLTRLEPASAEEMLSAIRDAHQAAILSSRGFNLTQLRKKHGDLNKEIQSLEADIRGIDEALERVEWDIISEAMIVATTLTQSYLRDSIQSRRFDTVILDEASMAPIPALWVAASLATENAVVVGDFMQLPPIVLSDHELALEWLGKDVFKVARLTDIKSAPPYLVPLRLQFRMHPDISAIVNHLIYEKQLRDDKKTTNEDELKDWYQSKWGYDRTVLLVDTESVHAWVTSIPRGRTSSRLNFLSATICVDLAERLLRHDRPKFSEGKEARILIICPYRPHAELLQRLLRQQGLEKEVLAGTAHSFQGSEASVVIVDLVNDEPHWRVALFDPRNDERSKQLLNVAITRARHRLIIVGDFNYIEKNARKAFIGSKMLPYLKTHCQTVDALEIVPADLAVRAAKAQSSIHGGDLEPDKDRLVVTQEHFYRILRSDLGKARRRVIIYSAFITANRLAQLEPQLRAAIERGTQVFVVTKTLSERRQGELSAYNRIEKALTEWGIVVVHKRGMHEKLVFIDDEFLWLGSLNPLSFADTQEIMERRRSKEVVKDFAQILRLEELLREYNAGRPECPVCRAEVVASEGRSEPFYWQCVAPKCYTRSIDQRPIGADGVVVCAKCGGGVEYGEWGENSVWRCQQNRRHHQTIARTHLLLRAMREKVPPRKLISLDKVFGTAQTNTRSRKEHGKQANLF